MYVYICNIYIHIFIYIYKYIYMYIYIVSRAKWWTLKKCSHEFGPNKRIGRTAAVFYPDRRTPSVHHKKGRPSAATSHELQPGNPSFLHLRSPPQRPASNSEVEQITRNTGLGKPLGYYPNTSTRCYTTTRRSNDPARRRPRRQRRHKNHHGHKDKQNSGFRPSSAQAADTKTLTLQA